MKIKISDLKMRVAGSMFRDMDASDSVFHHQYYIEVRIKPRKWIPYGTDAEGIVKFSTRECAEARIAELKNGGAE